MKMKTSKSALKRIKKTTSSGKILVQGMSAQHRAKGKSKRTKKNAALTFDVAKANLKTLRKLLPYK